MTSAFIIEVNSELKSDPNDETNALLRVLIYKIDSTTFGDSVPTLPQWSGPPRTIILVQTMLYASLAASILSAFLATLGKQWLNRYASVNMRGSAIERSQNRQRKLNGIVTWYFDSVMESLPLMLQFALLLLGCALFVYLWGIHRVVASVILSVTAFGVAFYAFVVVAGAISVSCPYQTPGAHILRWLLQKVPIHPTFFAAKDPAARHPGTQPGPEQTFDREATTLDFRCISWILQTSLDRRINQLTLEFLMTILMLPGFKTIITVDCLKIFISCIRVTDHRVVVIRGSEKLAEMAAMCLLGTISYSLGVDPRPGFLKDVEQQYNTILPPVADFGDLPFRHTIHGIHRLFNRGDRQECPGWNDVDPSAPENLLLAHRLVTVAWLNYQKIELEGRKKVPRWVLRFSLHSLLWNPEPPVSVIADCLMVVAIDLGCDMLESDIRNPDKRYASLAQLHNLSR